MLSPIQTLPNMPLDILREVVDFAASSDTHTALNLTLVSSAVRLWTLPILYHSVRLSTARAVIKFLEALSPASESSKLPSLTPYTPLHRRVKNLGIFAIGPSDAIHRALSICTETRTIACGFCVPHEPPLRLPPTVREHHLIAMSCRDGIPFDSICISTTHLHVQVSLDCMALLVSIHDHLPQLTHLAISISMISLKPLGLVLPTVQRILNNTPSLFLRLQVMGLNSSEFVEAARSEWGKSDARLSIVKAPGSLSKQWLDTCRQGQSLWRA